MYVILVSVFYLRGEVGSQGLEFSLSGLVCRFLVVKSLYSSIHSSKYIVDCVQP
jgi:hypothetical protein